MENIKELKPVGDITMVCGSYIIEGFFNEETRSVSYETQGLKDEIGIDLQISLSLDPREAHRLIPEIAYNIKNKVKLKDELITSDLTGAPVQIKFVESKITEDLVAKIIFSDENFLLPFEEGCSKAYINQ